MPQPEHKIKPNTTSISNLFLDHLDLYSGNDFKVFGFITRKTTGWHKETQLCSVSYICKGTGIKSKDTVIESLNILLKDGWIVRKEIRVKNGISYEYTLSEDVDIDKISTSRESVPVEKIDQSKDSTGTSRKNRQVTGRKNRHNKINKKLNKQTKETILSSYEDSGDDPPTVYGDPEVSRVFEEGLKILGIPKYDGSIKENRKNAKIAINKFKQQGGADAVLAIFKASTESPFWNGKITNFNDVLRNGMKVAASLITEQKGGRLSYV